MKIPRFDSAIIVVSHTTELVRGQEHDLLEQFMPVVRRQSTTLDLAPIERIDAAGLSALITLYCEACKAGHSFKVLHPGRHVREILALVGLDRILVSQPEAGSAFAEPELQESAA